MGTKISNFNQCVQHVCGMEYQYIKTNYSSSYLQKAIQKNTDIEFIILWVGVWFLEIGALKCFGSLWEIL